MDDTNFLIRIGSIVVLAATAIFATWRAIRLQGRLDDSIQHAKDLAEQLEHYRTTPTTEQPKPSYPKATFTVKVFLRDRDTPWVMTNRSAAEASRDMRRIHRAVQTGDPVLTSTPGGIILRGSDIVSACSNRDT